MLRCFDSTIVRTKFMVRRTLAFPNFLVGLDDLVSIAPPPHVGDGSIGSVDIVEPSRR
jgi:hypothetical protein